MQEITKNVHDALNGDKRGFDALYQATSKAVYFTCLSLVKNESDAEDLTQDVYITAFEKLTSLSEPEKFAAWVKRIAVNKCMDFLATKGAHSEFPIDSEETDEEPVDENILPGEYVENKEKRRIVMEIMQKSLSDTQYRTVIMFYFNDMSIAEIAEVMDCPEGTVKYRLNAARSKIKKGVLNYEHRTDDRLYTFVGAPFLARLLTAESTELTVPAAEISSLLPAAKAAGNIGKKAFWDTLKGKLIIGTAAVAVVGGAAACAAVTINSSETTENTDDSYISDSFPAYYPNENSDNTGEDINSVFTADNVPEDNSVQSTGDYFYVDIPGGIRIVKYLGNDEYLTVPAELDGKKVLEIGDGEDGDFVLYSFEKGGAYIKEITLPEGLEHIGKSVFSFLSELKAVHFPESLESLGPFAFLNCSSLEGIELPDCEIDFYALFEDCISLKEITLPEGPTELFSTHQGCSSLESITVPASVETLDCTFMECTSLKTVTFKKNSALTSIGPSAFEDCQALESIIIPDGVDEIYDCAFRYCFDLSSVTLPNSLEDIDRHAFADCISLEEIVLPDSIKYIHPTAFEGCGKIRIIYKGKSYSAEEISELLTLFE